MTKLQVKTASNCTFEIEVELDDTVADVKRNIENSQGTDSYPADRLLVVHDGKILKDDTTTLKENGVTEESHLIILKRPKKSGSEGDSSGASASPSRKLATADTGAQPDAGASSTGQSTDSAAQTTQRTEPTSTGPNVTKLRVKTTGNYKFEIEVKLDDTIADVKRTIEASQGANSYPADCLLVIHSGRILKDETTLQENGVTEKILVVILTAKKKGPGGESLSDSTTPAKKLATESKDAGASSTGKSTDSAAQTRQPRLRDPRLGVLKPFPQELTSSSTGADSSGSSQYQPSRALLGCFLAYVEEILERIHGVPSESITTDYIHSFLKRATEERRRMREGADSSGPSQTGQPDTFEDFLIRVAQQHYAATASMEPASTGPNTRPLNLFPYDRPRNTQGQAVLARFMGSATNEPSGSGLGNVNQLTNAEQQAVDRLVAMGFDREAVMEAFLACDRNEDEAAIYLMEHHGDH